MLEAVATVRLPRAAKNGFDERTWLRRHGVHVVLPATAGGRRARGAASAASPTGCARCSRRSIAPGSTGERRGVVEGVVLGDDEALSRRGCGSASARRGSTTCSPSRGRTSCSSPADALALAWLIGMPRWLGELGALGAIGGYVLAVGPQPSVVRAGVAGALVSLAWLAARAA